MTLSHWSRLRFGRALDRGRPVGAQTEAMPSDCWAPQSPMAPSSRSLGRRQQRIEQLLPEATAVDRNVCAEPHSRLKRAAFAVGGDIVPVERDADLVDGRGLFDQERRFARSGYGSGDLNDPPFDK